MFGLDGSSATLLLFILIAILLFFLPFVLNISLARSRGKSVILMFLLTCIFSWIVTLVLAFMPRVDEIQRRA